MKTVKKVTTNSKTEPRLILKYLIDAPPERVFNAWINPKQFAGWWGPHHFSAPQVDLDVRLGGKIDVHMQGPKGSPWEKPYLMGGVFREISRYDRLVFTTTLPDGKGGVALENLNEVSFADKGGKTEQILNVTVLKHTPEMEGALSGMEQGWDQSLERLSTLFGGGDRIEKILELSATPSRVWRALTDHREFGAWFGVNLEGAFKPGRTARGKITHPGYEHLVMEVNVKEMQPEQLFSFTWHPYAIDPKKDYSKEAATVVEFQLRPSAGGTALQLSESGFEKVPAVRRAEALRMNDGGWTQQMENIAAHLVKNP